MQAAVLLEGTPAGGFDARLETFPKRTQRPALETTYSSSRLSQDNTRSTQYLPEKPNPPNDEQNMNVITKEDPRWMNCGHPIN